MPRVNLNQHRQTQLVAGEEGCWIRRNFVLQGEKRVRHRGIRSEANTPHGLDQLESSRMNGKQASGGPLCQKLHRPEVLFQDGVRETPAGQATGPWRGSACLIEPKSVHKIRVGPLPVANLWNRVEEESLQRPIIQTEQEDCSREKESARCLVS